MARERNKPQCSGSTVSDGPWRHRCTRTGTVKDDGNFYCRQHVPSLVKQRKVDREAKWKAEREAKDRRWALQEKADQAAERIVGLCRDLIRNLDDKCPKSCISQGQLIRKELKKIDEAKRQLDRSDA